MALPIYNNFTGAASGTTITTGNSGGTGNTAFNAVSIGTGAVAKFDNTHLLESTGSLLVSTPVTAEEVYVQWSSTAVGTVTSKVYFRIYLYFTAFPTNAFTLIDFLTAAGAGCASIWLDATGKPYAHNAANAGAGIGFTNAINLNAWSRIEGFITPSTTAGQISISLYNSPQSVTPTETEASSTSQVLGANIGEVQWGVTASTVASIGPFWMTNIGLALSAIGPATTAYTSTLAAIAAVTASIKRQPGKPFTATMAVGGSVARQIQRSLAATGTVYSSVNRSILPTLVALGVVYGIVVNRVARSLSAELVANASVVAARMKVAILVATFTVTVSTQKTAGRILAGVATVTGATGRSISRTVTSTVVTISLVVREILKLIPPAPLYVVQSSTNYYNSGSSGASSLVVTLPQNTTAGNCLIACVAHYYTQPSITTGSSADNWTPAILCSSSPTLSGIYMDPNCLGGQNTVTFTFGASGVEASYATVYEVAGINNGNPLDQTAASFGGTGTSWSSGTTGVTSQAIEIVVGIAFDFAPSTTLTGPPGWVNTPSVTFYTGNFSAMSGFMITNTTGTQTYSGTGAVSASYYNAIATFRGLNSGLGVTVNGAVNKTVNKLLSSITVDITSTIKRSISRNLKSSSTITGSTSRSVGRTVTATAVAAASTAMSKIKMVTLAAVTVVDAAVTRLTDKVVIGVTSVGAFVGRSSVKILTSVVNLIGALNKNVFKTFKGAFVVASSVATSKLHLVALAAITLTTSTVTRKILPNMVAAVILGSVTIRGVSRAIQGTFAVAGQTQRTAGRKVTSVIVATVTLTKQPHKLLNVTTVTTGSITRELSKLISSTAAATVAFSRLAAVHVTFAVQAVFKATVSSRRFVTLTAAFSITTSVTAQYFAHISAVLFKFGFATTRWFSSSVKNLWKSGQ